MQRIVAYVIVLAIASYLYYVAAGIRYTGPAGRIGPDAWPKAILLLTIATCVYAIGRELLAILAERRRRAAPAATAEKGVESGEAPSNPLLIGSGLAITLAYLLLVERIGFFLCTLLYLASFMVVGRYRRPGVIAATSLIGALAFVFVFMKIVYVSLPLGQGPFAEVSLTLMKLMGVR